MVDGHQFFPFNCSSLLSKVSSGEMSLSIDFPVDGDVLELVGGRMNQFYVARLDVISFWP